MFVGNEVEKSFDEDDGTDAGGLLGKLGERFMISFSFRFLLTHIWVLKEHIIAIYPSAATVKPVLVKG